MRVEKFSHSELFFSQSHVDFAPKIFHCKKHQYQFSLNSMWVPWRVDYILFIFVSPVPTKGLTRCRSWVGLWWMKATKWPLSQMDSCISEDLQTHGIRETCNLLPVFLPCHKWVLLQVSVKALPCPFACPSGLSVRGKVMGLADKIGMEDQGWLVYPLPGSLFA